MFFSEINTKTWAFTLLSNIYSCRIQKNNYFIMNLTNQSSTFSKHHNTIIPLNDHLLWAFQFCSLDLNSMSYFLSGFLIQHTLTIGNPPQSQAPPEMEMNSEKRKENSTKSAPAQSFVCVISTQPPAKATFLQRPEWLLWWRSVEETEEVFAYIPLCFLFSVCQDSLGAPWTHFFQNILKKQKNNKVVHVSCTSASLAVTRSTFITKQQCLCLLLCVGLLRKLFYEQTDRF